jgi:phospholipase C
VFSFIKAPIYQEGHPIDSTPADEQIFLVNTVNRLQSLPEWNNTAIITGGWYDHVLPPIVSRADNIENLQDERVNLAIIAANNHYAGFGPGTANIF